MKHKDVLALLILCGFKLKNKVWVNKESYLTIRIDKLTSCMPYELSVGFDDVWWFDAAGLIDELSKLDANK